MQKNMTTLKEIAKTKPKKQPKKKKEPKGKKEPTPKELRAVEIQALGDWLIWIEIAKERSNKELVTKENEIEFLEIIQNQFSELPQTQKALARLMTNYTELIANERYLDHAIAEIFKNVYQLERIEKITNKGGRPRKNDNEILEAAKAECLAWFLKTGKKPSGFKLSQLVETAMKSKKGVAKIDGNLYLCDRRAREILSKWQPPNVEFNRQELVKSFAN